MAVAIALGNCEFINRIAGSNLLTRCETAGNAVGPLFSPLLLEGGPDDLLAGDSLDANVFEVWVRSYTKPLWSASVIGWHRCRILVRPGCCSQIDDGVLTRVVAL